MDAWIKKKASLLDEMCFCSPEDVNSKSEENVNSSENKRTSELLLSSQNEEVSRENSSSDDSKSASRNLSSESTSDRSVDIKKKPDDLKFSPTKSCNSEKSSNDECQNTSYDSSGNESENISQKLPIIATYHSHKNVENKTDSSTISLNSEKSSDDESKNVLEDLPNDDFTTSVTATFGSKKSIKKTGLLSEKSYGDESKDTLDDSSHDDLIKKIKGSSLSVILVDYKLIKNKGNESKNASHENSDDESKNVSQNSSVGVVFGDEKAIKNKAKVSSNMTPKQMQKKQLQEKRQEEKQKEREEKKQKALEEKMKILQEKQKLKQEKMDQKQKEIEEKQKEKVLKEEKKKKEREEKELKRKEKEEKVELKRKEKDEIKRKELEEKQKLVEKQQKAAAAFVNFFTKKVDVSIDEKRTDETLEDAPFKFMPFEIKSDMRLAPAKRNVLSEGDKLYLTNALDCLDCKLYLDELKDGRKTAKNDKTWTFDEDDDVVIVEEINPGLTIEEQSKTRKKMRAKFLMFDGNRRPPYFGTWRKRSKIINPRKPFALDKEWFDYEIDSDEEWEDDSLGESLRGSDNEDKENESDNEYEVDNEFFVPHGHLSDDEINDDEEVISPEAHKAKLKLLKKEFEEEMQEKMHKIKPRVIGCIWFNKNQDNVDKAIHDFLKPLAIISNGPIIIKKRSEIVVNTPAVRGTQPLNEECIPEFLKFIHGSTKSRKSLSVEFLHYLLSKNSEVQVSKAKIMKQLREFATWTRKPDGGPALKKYCWFVNKTISDKYNVELPFIP